MKVNIVEFYPNKQDDVIGTIHAYLSDYDMDIRGIIVHKKRKKYFFQMPMRKVIEDGNKIRFSILSFRDDKKNADFKKSLFGACLKYMRKKNANRKPKKAKS